MVGAASADFLMYSGYVTMAYFWALQAAVAQEKLDNGGAEQPEFYQAKLQTAEFYFERLLPRAQAKPGTPPPPENRRLADALFPQAAKLPQPQAPAEERIERLVAMSRNLATIHVGETVGFDRVAALWRLREDISESITPRTPYKNDVSVVISRAPAFIAELDALLAQHNGAAMSPGDAA